MLFRAPPSDFNKEVDVVGCFVVWDGRFLLLHRHEHKPNGGLWGLPAGKKESQESIVHAMMRELREETGLEVNERDLTLCDSIFVRHAGKDFEYHMFTLSAAEEPAIALSPTEHQAFQWVTPEESLAMPLVHDQAECTKIVFGIE